MFDELLRKASELEQGVRIAIDIPLDEKGYFDRECPNEECQAEFKVLFEDWKEKVRDEVAYCPICRYECPSTEWNTKPQVEYIQNAAMAHLLGVVDDALQPRCGAI